jgi:hypothetical protein
LFKRFSKYLMSEIYDNYDEKKFSKARLKRSFPPASAN